MESVAPPTAWRDALGVLDEAPGADELLDMWRDAARAAELADRLAGVAAKTLAHADRAALDTEALADLAEQASEAADRAAVRARAVAAAARGLAVESRQAGLTAAESLAAAQGDFGDKRALEAVARDRYTKHEQDAASRSGRLQDQDSPLVREPHEQ